jgi:hypothetical protein
MKLYPPSTGPAAHLAGISDPSGIVVNDDLLRRVGLADLPARHRLLMVRFIYERIAIRVSVAARTVLSDEQAAEYDHLPYIGDEQRRLAWLASNCSGYPRIVEQEMSTLLNELRDNAPDLLEASKSMAGAREPALEEVAHYA